MVQALSFREYEPRGMLRPAFGLGLVLLIHMGLLAVLKEPGRPQDTVDEDRPPPMLWLAPIKPPKPAPRTAPEKKAPEYAPPPRASRPSAKPIPVPPVPTAIAQPEAITPPAPVEASRDAPTFDVNAALKSARVIATKRAGKDDIPLDQFKDRPVNEISTESRLGKEIAKSARPGCVDMIRGAGTLAPLVAAYVTLTDKKDSGCKW
ncbi:hypothetical protein [Pseudoduganella violacea]|uniref:Uncharacterized protein n=1 Tax=Pseudoduganella violacea TaxID=1715466 RepID=A0A7W5B8P2_9BURK|nr:hypothetical protein [Pseudoduganella violacea]MBB3118255.1 hypothetical protein [Pseudoduganella violacea]